MSVTQTTCGCGTTTAGEAAASGPCTCGCCGTPAPELSAEGRILELRALRDAIDLELAELEQG
jgi:hypothetical protein